MNEIHKDNLKNRKSLKYPYMVKHHALQSETPTI